uniref:Uncharacterized protein n=1 Tax=Mycena chlorophos TaxID=658473 RepID=A0ABQ0M5J6_MYCCL|nr:predicted protein [Mycena chlorophos]
MDEDAPRSKRRKNNNDESSRPQGNIRALYADFDATAFYTHSDDNSKSPRPNTVRTAPSRQLTPTPTGSSMLAVIAELTRNGAFGAPLPDIVKRDWQDDWLEYHPPPEIFAARETLGGPLPEHPKWKKPEDNQGIVSDVDDREDQSWQRPSRPLALQLPALDPEYLNPPPRSFTTWHWPIAPGCKGNIHDLYAPVDPRALYDDDSDSDLRLRARQSTSRKPTRLEVNARANRTSGRDAFGVRLPNLFRIDWIEYHPPPEVFAVRAHQGGPLPYPRWGDLNGDISDITDWDDITDLDDEAQPKQEEVEEMPTVVKKEEDDEDVSAARHEPQPSGAMLPIVKCAADELVDIKPKKEEQLEDVFMDLDSHTSV